MVIQTGDGNTLLPKQIEAFVYGENTWSDLEKHKVDLSGMPNAHFWRLANTSFSNADCIFSEDYPIHFSVCQECSAMQCSIPRGSAYWQNSRVVHVHCQYTISTPILQERDSADDIKHSLYSFIYSSNNVPRNGWQAETPCRSSRITKQPSLHFYQKHERSHLSVKSAIERGEDLPQPVHHAILHRRVVGYAQSNRSA